MKGHVILSHGLESGPEATKVSALAAIAEQHGWTHQRPDYRDLDAIGPLGDTEQRALRLRELALKVRGPLLLAGSSMGAFISAQVSRDVPAVGLFLMAPPIVLETYPRMLQAASIPTMIIHGWDDELIPAQDVMRWAQRRRDQLLMVADSHRLAQHVDFCATAFGRFLTSLS